MEDDSEDVNNNRYLSFMGAPFVLIVAPICGFFLGRWLDDYFDTKPYLAYFLLFLGIVSGIREFYKLVYLFDDSDKPKS